jgi:hypothetical protein
MFSEEVEQYAAFLLRASGWTEADFNRLGDRNEVGFSILMGYWNTQDMSLLELNRWAHQVHVANPQIRGEAIQLISDAKGRDVVIMEKTIPSSDWSAAKEQAKKDCEKINISDDVHIIPCSTFINNHEMNEMGYREEYPQIDIYGITEEDVQAVIKQLEQIGYVRIE